jgi:trimethylamine:corrinoid methyltransferase-like protein
MRTKVLKTLSKVLSEHEKAQIHERALKILSETGVQAKTEKRGDFSIDKNIIEHGALHPLGELPKKMFAQA